IRRALAQRLQPLGIVVNRWREQSAEQQFRLREMQEMFGPLVLTPQLPERTALQQAQGAAKPVHLWPGDNAAEMARHFDQLLDRVVAAARQPESAGDEVPTGAGPASGTPVATKTTPAKPNRKSRKAGKGAKAEKGAKDSPA